MPRTKVQFENALRLEQEFQRRLETMSPDSDDWQKTADVVNKAGRIIQEYEAENRKTDDSGRLKKDAPGRLPARVGDGSGFNYHFEPSVREVQQAYAKDPELLKRLNPDRDWLGIAEPEKIEDVADPSSGMTVGQNVVPAKTYLDKLTDQDSAYKNYTDHVWRQRMEQAQQKGENLQRYSKVELGDQPVDYLAGGLEYNIDRRLAPAALGAADSFSLGQATPLYSAVRDLADYELGKRGVDTDFLPPSGEEVINRSPGSYLAGSFAGYALPGNPTNALQSSAEAAMAYRGMGPIAKAATSLQVGAGLNTVEGAAQDFSTALGQNKSIGEAASAAAENIPLNFMFGAAGGAVGDMIGQTAGGIRDAYRSQQRNAPIKTLEDAGGETSLITGVSPPPEIDQIARQSRAPRAVGSPGAIAAEQVAPQIQSSLEGQARAEQRRIHGQVEEYFNHPEYGQVKHNAAPIVDELIRMRGEGAFNAPVSQAPRNIDPDRVRNIDRELAILAEPQFMPIEHAREIASQNGFQIMDTASAQNIWGYGGDMPVGWVAVIKPVDVDARTLTGFEQRIDRQYKANEAGYRDPVYADINRASKAVRDRFDYYVDENGNLISPPGAGGAPQTPPGGGPAYDAEFVSSSPPTPPTESAPSGPPSSGGPGGAPPAGPGMPPGSGGGPALPPATMRSVAPEEATPLSLLAGNQLAMPESTRTPDAPPPINNDGNTEPLMRPPQRPDDMREPRSPDLREVLRSSVGQNGLADVSAVVRALGGDVEAAKRMILDAYEKGAIELRPEGGLKRYSPEEEALMIPGPQGTQLSKIRIVDESALAPDVSVPAPSPKEWTAATNEGENWYDEIVTPGAPARSSEMKRMADLTEQQRALEEAKAQVRDIEDRFGKLSDEDREKSLLGILKNKLGREVTREDLVKAGLLAGGAATVAATDDDEAGGAAVAVGAMLPGGRRRRQTVGQIANALDGPGLSANMREFVGALRNIGAGAIRPGNGVLDRIEQMAREFGLDEREMVQVGNALDQQEQIFGIAPPRNTSDVSYGDVRRATAKAAGEVDPLEQVPFEDPYMRQRQREREEFLRNRDRPAPDAADLTDRAIARIDEMMQEARGGAESVRLDEIGTYVGQGVDNETGLPVVDSPRSREARSFTNGASKPLADSGHKVQRGVDYSLKNIFGEGKDAAELARAWNLDDLKKIGGDRVESVISPYGQNGVVWRAYGTDGKKEAAAWRIERTIRREGNQIIVDHQYFKLREDLRAAGDGAKVIKNQMEQYKKMGVNRVNIDSTAWVGRYYWPSLGFDNPEAVPAALRAYREYLMKRHGLSDQQARAATKGIKSLPSLANAEHGKDFFLDDAYDGEWNRNLTMKLDDSNPRYQFMKKRLDIMVATGVGLGALMSDDQDTEDAGLGAAAIIGGSGGGRRRGRGRDRTPPSGGPTSLMDELHPKPKKEPRQLEATLDDGETVRGFSALRRQQHTEQEAIERSHKRVGAGGDKTIRDRVIGFNQGDDKIFDEALLEEARKLGLEDELYRAAGASVYGSLRDRAFFGGNEGVWKGLVDFAGLRGDKLLGLLAGVPRNPYAGPPNSTLGRLQQTMLEDPARRLLNLTGGRTGARHGDDARRIYEALQQQSEEREGQQ